MFDDQDSLDWTRVDDESLVPWREARALSLIFSAIWRKGKMEQK